MPEDHLTHVPALPPSVLEGNEVHVWHAFLSELDLGRFPCESLLSEKERQRAARFRFARDREQSIHSRALLRMLLESYGVAPARKLRFVYSPRGKPDLDPQYHAQRPSFSLSHSGGLVVYAVSRSFRVGVDVELVREVPDADRIVERYFSAEERAEYRASVPADRQRAFFNGWVRKEAFIKATGEGLSRALSSFSVTLASDQDVQLRISTPTAGDTADWCLRKVSLDPRYTAAVAVQTSACSLRVRELTIDATDR